MIFYVQVFHAKYMICVGKIDLRHPVTNLERGGVPFAQIAVSCLGYFDFILNEALGVHV